MKRHIPNFITILNLLSGVMAIIMASDGLLYQAAIFIAAGAIFDLLDGLVARALGVSSPIGKQLDSLADMVTFGVAPALIARELIFKGLFIDTGQVALEGLYQVLPFVPFFMVACSAIRLAKFNLDVSQVLDFKGLPSPANALFWLSIPLAANVHQPMHIHLLESPFYLSLACILLGLLMITDLRLLSMKLDKANKVRSRWQFGFILLSLGLFIFLRFSALPFIIVLYLLLSFIRNITERNEIQS